MRVSTLPKELPKIVYVQTVVNKAADGRLVMRGMFVGDDNECFERAAELESAVQLPDDGSGDSQGGGVSLIRMSFGLPGWGTRASTGRGWRWRMGRS